MLTQVWEFWNGLDPIGRAFTFFPLGLSVGSFLTVLFHRLPRGTDPVRGRSHCTHCGAELQIRELIPIFSFLIQKGCCLRCGAAIGWRYPLTEAAVGALGAFGGYFGWSQGVAILAGLIGLTILKGRRRLAQSGSMVVDVLVSVALLATIIVPLLSFSTIFNGGATYPRQLAASLAVTKIEELATVAYRTNYEADLCRWSSPDPKPSPVWPISGSSPPPPITGYSWQWTVSDISSANADWLPERDHVKEVTVTVTSPNLRTPVVLVAWIGKLEMEPVDPYTPWC